MHKANYMLNNNLFDQYMMTMNFLNEISIEFPDAVSFGSGRPDKNFFNVKDVVSGFFSTANKKLSVNNEEEFINDVGQYNRTNGIINDAISRLLLNDENIKADADDIIITVGAQEGMAIVINTLFNPGNQNEVILVSDPSYIGFVGYAKILGITVIAIERDEDGINLEDIENTIIYLKKNGKIPKLLYEVVDFHNPTGAYMSLEKREKLIELARAHDFLIVEDNPYGYYRYDVEKIPTLKSLDRHKCVIYLGSFSKTIFPSIRIGYLVIDQTMKNEHGNIRLVDECKKTKSYITVNTPNILQVMVEDLLVRNEYSLLSWCQPRVDGCRRSRDAMIEAMEHFFPISESWTEGIKWHVPKGGFFLIMDIPFRMTNQLLRECVKDYGVIVCPISFFYLTPERENRQIRLAFSNTSKLLIREGLLRLAKFIKAKRKIVG